MRTPTVDAKRRREGTLRTTTAAVSAALRQPATVGAAAALSRPGRVRTRADLRAERDVVRYGTVSTVDVTPPPNAPPGLRRATGAYDLDRPFVATVADAVLLADCGLVVDDAGAILLETALGRRDLVDRALLETPRTLAAAALDAGRLTKVDAAHCTEPVCSLVDAALGGYSHWLLTAVPRLAGLEHWERATGERARLLLPSTPAPWVRGTLELLGYGDRLRTFDGTPTRFDTLVVPSVRSPEQRRSAYVKAFTFDPSYKLVAPGACAWIAERAARNRPDGTSLPRRLYVSREDADRRQVRNREELRSTLREAGFVSFVPTAHSIAEQAAHFAAADVVVAPHGAALSNLVYAEDTAVVEVFGVGVKPTYCMLASSLDLEYAAVVGGDEVDGSFHVDPAAVLAALRELDGI